MQCKKGRDPSFVGELKSPALMEKAEFVRRDLGASLPQGLRAPSRLTEAPLPDDVKVYRRIGVTSTPVSDVIQIY